MNKEIFEYIIEGYFVLKGTTRRVTTEEIIELYEILKQVDNDQSTPQYPVIGPNIGFPAYPEYPKYEDTPMKIDCEPWGGCHYNKWGQYVCPSSVRIDCDET